MPRRESQVEWPDESKHRPIEETPVFEIFESVAQWAWDSVRSWDFFAKDTVGKQMVRALDSVNANLVEGDGRFSDLDALRHLVIARASAREGRLWVIRAKNRNLIDPEEGMARILQMEEGTRQLNLLINYRRKTANKYVVREEQYHREFYSGPIEGPSELDSEIL